MGYSYGRNARGNWVLSCDGCGTVGDVRKRTCPHKVTGDSLRGPRYAMSYCPAPALCAGCFKREGGTRGLHARCAEPARKSQAEYDAKQARIDAGELFVLAAWGDWQAGVPGGMCGVKFGGRDGEAWHLVPAGDYHPGKLPGLSDYPQAQPWAEHPR